MQSTSAMSKIATLATAVTAAFELAVLDELADPSPSTTAEVDVLANA